MEHACITKNKQQFSQSKGTPPMQPNLINRIGLYTEKQGAEQILGGTFDFLTDGDPYMQELVSEMRMEDRVRAAGPIPTAISQAEHNQGWKKQNEQTASASAGLSFSDHKAAIDDKDMAEINRLLREIPYNQGFSPDLNQIITNFEILKKSGVYDVKKMRTIQLFITYFNMNNKKTGRES